MEKNVKTKPTARRRRLHAGRVRSPNPTAGLRLRLRPADAPAGAAPGTHDIPKTVAELKARGVEFTEEVADHGCGLVTHFKMPGNCQVQLYEPRFQKKPSRK